LSSCRSAATSDEMRWIASRANCARDIQTSSIRRTVPHRLFRLQGEFHGAQGRVASRRTTRGSTSLSFAMEQFPLFTSSSTGRRHRASIRETGRGYLECAHRRMTSLRSPSRAYALRVRCRRTAAAVRTAAAGVRRQQRKLDFCLEPGGTFYPTKHAEHLCLRAIYAFARQVALTEVAARRTNAYVG
jgi:hypothetical protein